MTTIVASVIWGLIFAFAWQFYGWIGIFSVFTLFGGLYLYQVGKILYTARKIRKEMDK